MENQGSYKMPDRRLDGMNQRARAQGAPGTNQPGLETHYGAAGDEAMSEMQELNALQASHVERMYELYDEFEQATRADHDRIRTNRLIYELRDPMAGANEPQLPILLSTIQNKIADQMDNMPEAVLVPESPMMQEYAEDATDVVRWIFERNDYDSLYQSLTEDFYVAGTAMVQIHWDEDMDNGDGNVRIIRVPIDTVVWDPTARDLQSCRAIFKTIYHPKGWYQEHYPEAGRFVQPDSYFDPDRERMMRDEDVMMLECWWREYDAASEKYRIHVSHMAGHVLLYDSRDEFPEGLYAHGQYPFAMCTYRNSISTLAGRSCVEDYVELNRYANRNAKYIDWSTRFAARPKLLIGQGLELRNETEITDAEKQIVHIDGMLNGSNLVWMPTPQVPPMAYQMQLWYIDALKQESGQNQFARGEGGMGVTAASAIQSLQEAGAKSSRMESQRLSGLYRHATEQILWLVAQFYDPPRVIMITGNPQSPYAAREMIAGRQMVTSDIDLHPAYRVNLQIRRRNPLRIESENELILELYQISAQAGQPMSAADVLELLQVDGKERILPKLKEMSAQQQALLQAQAEAQANAEQAQAAQQQLGAIQNRMISEGQALIDEANGIEQNSVYG